MADVSNGSTPDTYTWSDGSTIVSNIIDTSGHYFVTVSDNNLCMVIGSINITEDTVAIAYAGTDDTICHSSQVNLSGAIGGAANSITWGTLGNGEFVDIALFAN